MVSKIQVSSTRQMRATCNHRDEWQTVKVRRAGYVKVWSERRCATCGRLAQG